MGLMTEMFSTPSSGSFQNNDPFFILFMDERQRNVPEIYFAKAPNQYFNLYERKSASFSREPFRKIHEDRDTFENEFLTRLTEGVKQKDWRPSGQVLVEDS